MRRLGAAALVVLLAGCYTGEGSGELAYRAYAVDAFSRISLAGALEVDVVEGDFRVVASAEDNILPTVVVRVRDGTLLLGRDVDWIDGIRPTLPARVTVFAPELGGLSVAGNGHATVRGVGATAVRFAVSGSGGLALADVPAEVVEIDLEGSATLSATGIDATAVALAMQDSSQAVVAGRTQALHVDVSGSVVHRGIDLLAVRATVDVDGAAQAFVWVQEALVARVGGVGRLAYRGEPSVEQTIRREGRLLPLGLADGP